MVTTLARKNTHTVELSLNGYEDQSLILNRSVSGWVWGNIIFGGLIGLAVDASTGALYKLTPEEVRVNMEYSSASNSSGDALMISVVLAPSEDWEQIGQLTPVSDN